MKSVQVFEYGNADTLTLSEVPGAQPDKDEALVRLAYAGVNFIDVYMRQGLYARNRAYPTALPFTLGMEGAGIVERIGDGVEGLAPGDRVAYCLSPGSYAESACVPAWRLVKVPEGVSLESAAALMLQGCTAHYLTRSLFPLMPGHACLVHAGAGGVGQLLIQLAKLAGTRVITTVGGADKAEVARARGADVVIPYRERDFREEVLKATDGEGVDVVYESVGRATFHKSLYSLKRRGMIIVFGAASGAVEPIDPAILADAGSVLLARPNLADYMATREEVNERAREVFDLVREGRLRFAIDRAYPLAEAARAHRDLEARKTKGKLLIAIRPELDRP